jgi:hypothetical protein
LWNHRDLGSGGRPRLGKRESWEGIPKSRGTPSNLFWSITANLQIDLKIHLQMDWQQRAEKSDTVQEGNFQKPNEMTLLLHISRSWQMIPNILISRLNLFRILKRWITPNFRHRGSTPSHKT